MTNYIVMLLNTDMFLSHIGETRESARHHFGQAIPSQLQSESIFALESEGSLSGMGRGSWGGAGKGSRISWGQEYGDQGKIG